MIDRRELDGMRQRADAARPAVEAVTLRRGEGLYAGLPHDDPVALLELTADAARDALALVAECEWLAPAAYLHGPEACVEGDCDCDDKPDGQWCSRVTERVATLGDVKQGEFLQRLVDSLRGRLVAGEDPAGLVEAIDDALEVMRADDDIAAVVATAELVGLQPSGSPHDRGQK